jgi:hypothetical protein
MIMLSGNGGHVNDVEQLKDHYRCTVLLVSCLLGSAGWSNAEIDTLLDQWEVPSAARDEAAQLEPGHFFRMLPALLSYLRWEPVRLQLEADGA